MSTDPVSSVNTVAAYSAQTQAAAAADPGTNGSPANVTGSTGQLDQNQFLQLMVAQLKNQDPTKPMDPSTFVGQLAQFSTVTGIENMQTSLSTLATSMRSSQILSGTSLVGHQVLAPATATTIAAGDTVTGAADVQTGTTALQVNVLDSSGQQVRTFSVTPQTGLTNFTWDGRTDSGVLASAGQYTFKVIAGTGSSATSLAPLLSAKVASVTIDPTTQDLTLNTNAGALALSTVRQVM
ncbi:MAG: flagellar basal body rod protein FlgD [Gammaproteobacteria bacterium]|nr:flagellar basal body rod protein FlgD [Gammaproteobacteria bacterium]